MKRFDDQGRKLGYDVDCPTSFSFKPEYLNADLGAKEKAGYDETPGLKH